MKFFLVYTMRRLTHGYTVGFNTRGKKNKEKEMTAEKKAAYTKEFPFKKDKKCSNKRYLHEGKIAADNNGKELRHLMPYYINVINRRYTGYKVRVVTRCFVTGVVSCGVI